MGSIGSVPDHCLSFYPAPFSNRGYWVSFMMSLICKYTSNTISAKTPPFKVFIISLSLVNFIVKTLDLRLSKF